MPPRARGDLLVRRCRPGSAVVSDRADNCPGVRRLGAKRRRVVQPGLWIHEPKLGTGPRDSCRSRQYDRPRGPDQGQPTYFLPRRSRFVFKIRVPADFGEKELVWTLTSNGKTEWAYGTLKPDYFIDSGVVQANYGAAGAAGTTPELPGNLPPSLVVEGPARRTVGVGEPLALTAVVTDDGKPRARPLPPTSARSPGPVTTDSATGLRFSWFVYRGHGQSAVFEPTQISVWEDTRPGNDSPWAPGFRAPDSPEDGRWIATAAFSERGTYVLRAIAHDGGLATTEEITVVVTQ